MEKDNVFIRTYKYGKTHIGYLKKDLIEIPCKVKGYKLAYKLVFKDEKGKWLYTEYWNLNKRKEAEKEILNLGYKKLDNVK